MSRIWMVEAIRAQGIAVHTADGWMSRGSSSDFEPRGVLIHHTAAVSSMDNRFPSLNTVIHGRPDLSGPLCHFLVGRAGGVYAIATGRAHHAGVARASGPMPAGDGNTMYAGIEIDYHPDHQAVGREQRRSALICAAVILHELGRRSAQYMRAHKETSVTGKIDPSNFLSSISDARASLQDAMDSRGWG